MSNVQRGGEGGPLQWWTSIPPITRYYATTCLLTSVGAHYGFVPIYSCVLLWPKILRLEIWRLITPFFVIGRLSLSTLFVTIWIVQYGTSLESNTFADNTADFAYMFLVCMLACLAVSLAYSIVVFGTSMAFALIYVWAREVPDQTVTLMGLVPVQSFYLPFALAGLELLLGHDIAPAVVGLIAGHTYYFLKTVYPRRSGHDILATPRWFSNAIARSGIGRVPATQHTNSQHHPSQPGFRAFSGQGRRL